VLRDRKLVAQLTNGPEITTSKIMETIASGEHQ
jgi:simple sugar transport system ATP-binding protein